jgi:MoaA/NifB/PqqE/SkfB family radical SAM enzyme
MDKEFFEQEKTKYQIRDNKVLGLPGPFRMLLPEIYQIEICSKCNFNCVMCPKELYSREKDKTFIDPKIIEDMLARSEFEGSYLVELQMTGEPLLHPEIQNIINLIKSSGVMVGLSTNGSLLTPGFVSTRLAGLDYITISLDSVMHRDKIRVGFNKPFIVWYNHFLKDSILMLHLQGTTIDIQFIDLPGYQDEMNKFMEIAVDILPNVTLRTVPEGYFTLVNKGTYPYPSKGMCMNPFLSVSIQSQGHVTPCCFAWGDDIIYGDIKKNSLFEIWQGPKVEFLRNAHQYSGGVKDTPNCDVGMRFDLPEMCKRCYMRSPAFLHTNILYQSIRDKKGNWSV